jgi:hyperosmotically inducible protein
MKGRKMKILNKCKLIGMTTLILAGLSACDKPGPAERAGKEIDQTTDEALKKIGDTADSIGEKMSEESAKTAVALDDTGITTKVKAAIFAEPELKTLRISVETMQGVVTLSGSVDSMSNSQRAKELAGAVAGVKDVNNQLVVTSKK